ncbi:MAG: hypothetical protein ABI321_13275 [Polyangia bacterium]
MRPSLGLPLVLALAACAPATSTSGSDDGASNGALHTQRLPVAGDLGALCRPNGKEIKNAYDQPSYYASNGAGVMCSGSVGKLPAQSLLFNVGAVPTGIDTSSDDMAVRVTVSINNVVTTKTWTGRSFGPGSNGMRVDLFQVVNPDGQHDATVWIEVGQNVGLTIQQINIYDSHSHLAMGPGSKVYSDNEPITVEVSSDRTATLLVNGTPFDLEAGVASGSVAKAAVGARNVYTTTVAAIAGTQTGDLTLDATTTDGVAKMHVYRAHAACVYQGDPAGKKMLVTSFDPVLVGDPHQNVSSVAATQLDPSTLTGVQVMRLTLPVEFDSAGDLVVDAMRRCQPDIVVGFGEGMGLALEQTAYDLADSTNMDSRGAFQSGSPILAAGPESVASSLPLDALFTALGPALAAEPAVGTVDLHMSTDADGFYVCNNVFYRTVSEAAATGKTAGFIHLPATMKFDDASTAAWGELMRVIVQTIADNATASTTTNG